MIERIVLFGDDLGLPQLLRHIPQNIVSALVIAETRPQQHETIRILAAEYHLPLLVQPHVSSPTYSEFVEKVQNINPHLILVNSYSMIIHSDILAIASNNVINIHGALLPQYRGANPIQWCLLNNASETGVTMHYIDAGIDTGDIISQRQVPILIEDTWRDIQSRISDAIDDILTEEIPKILSGTNNRIPQNERDAKHWPRRKPEDGLIDWNMSVRHIYNKIRALVKPHPGAFYINNMGQKIVLDDYLNISQVIKMKYSESGGGKELKSKLIKLVPFSENDIPISLKKMNKHFVFPDIPEWEEKNLLWADFTMDYNNQIIFFIQILENNTIIGIGQINKINYQMQSSEIRINLETKEKSNPVFAADTINLLLTIAFRELDLHSAIITVHSTDDDYIKMCNKMGFRERKFSHELKEKTTATVGSMVLEIQRPNHE